MTEPNYQLRFPIGEFQKPEPITAAQLQDWMSVIEAFPATLGAIVSTLTPEQLQLRYRPGGWSIQQVVHHCADSHMNSLIRFKLALTEAQPTIRPYFEDRWAELADTVDAPISHSLTLLEGLHARWTVLLRSLTPSDLEREFVHPEHGTRVSLAENMGIYAWHCEHHLAHIKQALRQ